MDTLGLAFEGSADSAGSPSVYLAEAVDLAHLRAPRVQSVALPTMNRAPAPVVGYSLIAAIRATLPDKIAYQEAKAAENLPAGGGTDAPARAERGAVGDVVGSGLESEVSRCETVAPEINPAITASGVFDPSVTEEIGALVGDGLPFGDADALAELAGRVAGLLGLNIRSQLDSENLDSDVGRAQGVYNAAVSVLTEASGFTTALVEELRELQNCKDRAMTAAGHLLPGSCTQAIEGLPPSGPLAAPLRGNQSWLCRRRSWRHASEVARPN